MRWSSAVVLGILSQPCEAFVVNQSPSACLTSRSVSGGVGWDNEDFLEGLGQGKDAQEAANDDYYKHARMGRPEEDDDEITEEGIAGASLTKEMIERAKASHTPEEEASGGGKMFRELKRRAEEAAASGIKKPPAAMANPVPPPLAEEAADATGELTVEQQAALFRQMMAGQQPAMPQPPQQQSGRQPQGPAVGSDGKRIGRNRDADAIVNSADVYFAQLKRDSTLRNEARYAGDEETANQVFKDPSLHDIQLHVNPHLEEQRLKENSLIETSMDEMILPSMFEEKEEKPKSYSGISFKEKLKAKRGGGSAAKETQAAPKPAVEPPPVAKAPGKPEPVPEPVPEPPTKAATEPEKPSIVPSTQSSTSRATAGSDDVRSDVRTLMGLLMKHKGGPGFGVGRIVGPERERFEDLARSVTAVLREEALMFPDDLTGEGIDLQVGGQAEAAIAPASPAAEPSKVEGMVACIEGAILMFKNSPPELHESVIGTLRAALLAAVNTCNEVVGDNAEIGSAPTSATSGSTSERMTPMISCMEGAIQMYKNSPVEIRDSVLVTLRAALLASIATCNAIMADNEVLNVQAYQSSVAAPPKKESPVVAPPKETSSVVVPPKEDSPAAASPQKDSPAAVAPPKVVSSPVVETPPPPAEPEEIFVGDDPNTGFLVDVYERLKAATGDGKLGLSKDLTAEEASKLADDIADTRVLLVDELDQGIPKATNKKEASSTSSKYKKLLSRAKGK